MYNTGMIKGRPILCLFSFSDVNKSVFDWCKEGNVKRMDLLLSKGEDVNQKDNQVENNKFVDASNEDE